MMGKVYIYMYVYYDDITDGSLVSWLVGWLKVLAIEKRRCFFVGSWIR